MSRLVAVLCLVVTEMNLVTATCSFPETLLADTWSAHFSPSTSQGNKVLQANFTVHQMNVQLRSFAICTRQCISGIGDISTTVVGSQTYLVRETCEDGAPLYRCIRFLNRSATVIQLKSSTVPAHNIPTDTESFCADDNLEVESWPLARPVRDSTEYVDCPLAGGFEMTLETSKRYSFFGRSKDKCVPLALDGRCLPGEKLSFDFKERMCLPSNVRPTLKASLQGSCTAFWQEGNDTLAFFVAAEEQNKRVSRYTLRFSTSHGNDMNATLFVSPGLVSFRSEDLQWDINANAIDLRLKRSVERTWIELCQDDNNLNDCEWAICDGRYGPYGHRCLRSCGHCNDTFNRIATTCTFPSKYSGQWKSVVTTTADNRGLISGSLTVLNETIYAPEYGKMTCIDFPPESSPPVGTINSDHFVVLSMPTNGCRPRYKCLALQKDGKKLRWRINNGFEPWPGYGRRLPSFFSVCNETLRDWPEWKILNGSADLAPGLCVTISFLLAAILCT